MVATPGLLLLLLTSLPALVTGTCSVNLDRLTAKYPPLLLQGGQFFFPTAVPAEDEDRIISFEVGAGLELYCHAGEQYQAKQTLLLGGRLDTGSSSLQLTCGPTGWQAANGAVTVEETGCTKKQEPRLVRRAEQCSPVGADGVAAPGQLTRVSLGWQLPAGFQEQIGLCVDEGTAGTVWTNHTVRGASIAMRDMDPSRPSFRTDTTRQRRYFTWTTSTGMNNFYTKKNQQARMKKLLGANKMAGGALIIDSSTRGTHYFAKGHLAPDAAFVYNALQDATYYFFNVAPQFQSFNNGNWKALEINTRQLAEQLGRDLRVWTGTHGSLAYPDQNNNLVPVTLAASEDSPAGLVPAPLYYWKVLHDPQTDTAVAFIGLNDPHATAAPAPLCTDRCGEMGWVDWDRTDLGSGYMYCCEVEEAARAIPAIPAMKAAGLLGGTGAGPVTPGANTANTCSAGPCTCTCPETAGLFTCTCTCRAAGSATTTTK